MLAIKEIKEKQVWESFLLKNEEQKSFPFFQTWNWGQVQKSLGNTIWYFGLYEKEILVGVFLIVLVKAKRGCYILWRHGPAILQNKEQFIYVLSFLKNLAKENKASFIRISRFFKNDFFSKDYFKQLGFIKSPLQTIDAEVCWVLNIKSSEDELLKNMRKSHRYLIKKAQSIDLKIIKTTDPKDIALFLPLYKKLAVRQHFIEHKGLEEEFKIFAKDNQAQLFLAKFEDKIIASAFIDFVGDIAIYRHGASDENFKQIPASYLLQWEAIKEAKKRNKKFYNFWGISPIGAKNHPWQGLTLFKTGFGGDYEYSFPTMDLPLSLIYWKTFIIDFISKIKKGS